MKVPDCKGNSFLGPFDPGYLHKCQLSNVNYEAQFRMLNRLRCNGRCEIGRGIGCESELHDVYWREREHCPSPARRKHICDGGGEMSNHLLLGYVG
jgi:hypothetical protein